MGHCARDPLAPGDYEYQVETMRDTSIAAEPLNSRPRTFHK